MKRISEALAFQTVLAPQSVAASTDKTTAYVKGRQFYSWTKAKALELALKAADRVLSRIADEVDY